MPDNLTSKTEKAKVIVRIKDEIGPVFSTQTRRPDWWVSGDHSLSFLVTFSRSDQLFYDVKQADLEELESSPKGYVIFVLGRHSETLIIPARRLHEQLKEHHKTTDEGNYKLHVRQQDNSYHFHELQHVVIKGFYNNFSQFKSDSVSPKTIKKVTLQVILDPDVAKYFKNSKSVNDALRALITISENIQLKSA